MIPSVVGILVIGLGLVVVYAGVHGIPGLLDVQPRSVYGGTGTAAAQ